jgi:hypothetical protein
VVDVVGVEQAADRGQGGEHTGQADHCEDGESGEVLRAVVW